MGNPQFALGALLALTALAGCQRDPAPEPAVEAAPEAAPAAADEPNPAVRQAEAPEETAPTGIATQPGPNGSEVTLRSLRVTGNLVNAEFTYQASPDRVMGQTIRLSDVSLIDDATTQRYEVV